MKIKTDFLFTLALFCVFAGTALATVWIGANIYRSTAQAMEENYDTRTALAYVSEKLRQNDSSEAIQVVDDATICLTQTIEGLAYHTYIYYYQGALRELMTEADQDFAPEDGEEILAVQDFSITPLTDSLYQIATSTPGGQLNLTLHTQSSPH